MGKPGDGMATPQSKWRVTDLPGICPSGLTKDQRPHEPDFAQLQDYETCA